MARGSTRRAGVGVQQAWYGLWDNLGFFIGASATAPAAGESSHARRLYGMKELTRTIPESETIPIEGDDTLLAELEYPSNATRRFTASLAAADLTLINHVQASSTRYWGETAVTPLDPATLSSRNFAVWYQSRTAGLDENRQRTTTEWSGEMIHLASMLYLGRESWQSRTAGNYRFSITPQRSLYEISGFTLTDAYASVCNEGAADIGGEYPITATAFTGNGVLATIPTLLAPISTAKVLVAVNRVAATVTGVNTTAPYGVTISSAPANGARVEVIYEYDGDNC